MPDQTTPRTIHNTDQLAALPIGAVVRERDGAITVREGYDRARSIGYSDDGPWFTTALPAELLWTPGDAQSLAAGSPVPEPSEPDSDPATDSAAAWNRGHSSTVTPGDARRQLLSPFDWPHGLTDQQARRAGEHATAFLGDVIDLLDLADQHQLDPGDTGEREALRILGATVVGVAQAIGWRAPTWSTPPVSQIEAVAVAWMRHLGYTPDQIEAAETHSCNVTCERSGDAWDCVDEYGNSRHPIADDLAAGALMAHVALDALTEYAALADDEDDCPHDTEIVNGNCPCGAIIENGPRQ